MPVMDSGDSLPMVPEDFESSFEAVDVDPAELLLA